MNCPNCNSQMDKGRYTDTQWFSGERKEKVKKSLLGRVMGLDSMNQLAKLEYISEVVTGQKPNVEYVAAYRCPKCGKLELYSDVSN